MQLLLFMYTRVSLAVDPLFQKTFFSLLFAKQHVRSFELFMRCTIG